MVRCRLCFVLIHRADSSKLLRFSEALSPPNHSRNEQMMSALMIRILCRVGRRFASSWYDSKQNLRIQSIWIMSSAQPVNRSDVSKHSIHLNNESVSKIVEYWMRIVLDNDSISMIHIVQIMVDYFDKSKILAWSTKYINVSGLKLSDNNRKVERIKASNSGYCWVTADTEPVFEGKHCWRLKIDNPRNGWMCYGVAAPKILKHGNFNQPRGYIWAIGQNDWHWLLVSNIHKHKQ